ncbi:MAG: hypothetical protein ACREFP_07785 [Acetobacteraceae bacterium]
MGFTAAAGQLVIDPDSDHGLFAALGLGADKSPFTCGELATKLPEGTV